MSNYKILKDANIKFPMSEEMLQYYTNLGFKCFVIKYRQRMDGSFYISPELFYCKDGIIDCVNYSLFDIEVIKHFLRGCDLNKLRLKYKSKCDKLKEKYEKNSY